MKVKISKKDLKEGNGSPIKRNMVRGNMNFYGDSGVKISDVLKDKRFLNILFDELTKEL